MFITGLYFGSGANTCYLGVFDHGLNGFKDSDTIIIGNIFTRNVYVVYDMSPLEFNEDYIQIALGVQAPENMIGRQQYKPEDPAYKPNKKEFDSSSLREGAADPYLHPNYDKKEPERADEIEEDVKERQD
jgi:hypothetical protein